MIGFVVENRRRCAAGRRLGVVALVAIGLAGAAPLAHADSPPPVYLSPSIAKFTALDTQLTHFVVEVSCPADPAQSAPCPVTVGLTWRAANVRNYRPTGPAIPLDSATATLAPGQSEALTLSASPAKLRDVTARRHVAAIVYADLTDARTGEKVDQSQFAGPGGAFDRCPGPGYVPFTGGSVVAIDRQYDGTIVRSPILSGDLGVGEQMQVGPSPIRFTILGVTYRLSAHAVFDRTCWGLSDYHAGQAAPTVMLDSGTVQVSGKPYGPQIWVGIGTPEGNLGSRSQERVTFTVTRDARRQVSTMRVAVGHTTQVTPFDTPTRSPCTDGQALSVDRSGHIRRL